MKSNLLSLIKIEFQKFFSSFQGKRRKVHQQSSFYLILLVSLLVILAAVGYSYMIINPFMKIGVDTTMAVTFFAGLVSMLGFMSTLNQVRGIYIGDDYDMLSSMPIRKRDIVASKVFTLYVIELSFSLLILIPHGVMQIVLAGNVPAFFISLLLAFTLPIVPIAIAMLISFVVTVATARFKYANYIFTALYTLAIVGLVTLSMLVNNMKEGQAADSFMNIGGILKWINPSYLFIESYIAGNKIFLLVYVAVNIVVAIGSILFISLFFDRLHDIVSSMSMKEKYVRKDLKVKSPERVLLGLEFKRLANSKFYFVNSIMGMIMCILSCVVFVVSFNAGMSGQSDETVLSMTIAALPICAAVSLMIIGMSNPTTGCINIEGKNFWIIKTLPVDYKKYLRNKLLFAFALTIPGTLIASVIAVIFYHYEPISIVGAFVVPASYAVMNALIGIHVALKHPKLKWTNEAEAVKNSASVVICLFIHLGLSLLFAACLVVPAILVPYMGWLGFAVAEGAIILASIPLYITLRHSFSRRIAEIEC